MDVSLDLGLNDTHVTKTSDDYYTPTALFAMGAENVAALSKFGRVR